MGVLASVVDMLYRDPSPSRELSRCEIRDQTRCGVGGTLGYEHYMRVVTIYPFLNTIVSAETPEEGSRKGLGEGGVRVINCKA